MNTMFTEHAVERMRERDVTRQDVEGLVKAVEQVSRDPDDLATSPQVVRIAREHGEDAFIVRAGDMRAVLTIDRGRPGQVIVLSVYRAEGAQAS